MRGTNKRTASKGRMLYSVPQHPTGEDKSSPDNPRVFFDISIDGRPASERIVIELFANVVPKTAEKFRVLCTGEKSTPEKPLHYKGTVFNCIYKGFHARGGEISKVRGGKSLFGGHFKGFEDEKFILQHSEPGMLSMCSSNHDASGSSFFITFSPIECFDRVHVAFGKVIAGMGTVDKINQMGTFSGKPSGVVEITHCGEMKNNVMESQEGKKKKTLMGVSSSDEQVEELNDERKKKRSKSSPYRLLQITDSGDVSDKAPTLGSKSATNEGKTTEVVDADLSDKMDHDEVLKMFYLRDAEAEAKLEDLMKIANAIAKEQADWFDGVHVGCGKVIDGMRTLDRINQMGTISGKPSGVVEITDCGEIKKNVMESHEGEKKKTLKRGSSSDVQEEDPGDERKKKQRKSRPSGPLQATNDLEDKNIKVIECDKGIRKTSFQFDLSDINTFISEEAEVKIEKATPPIPKPTARTLRSKSVTEKRKTTEVVDVDLPENMDHDEVLKKLHLGLEQMTKCFDATKKRAEEAEAKVEDLKKIVDAKTKTIELDAKEFASLKKELKEIRVQHDQELLLIKAQHSQELEEVLNVAKKSAAVTILQARIQMAEQAAGESFDATKWDVQGWRKALAVLGGEARGNLGPCFWKGNRWNGNSL